VNATTGRVVERVSYDAYGVGRHSFPGDTDGDGIFGASDLAALNAATASNTTARPITDAGYNPDLDVNADGVIDSGDYTALGVNPGTTVFTSGMPAGRISSGGAGTGSPDNDVGYCGYMFNHETQDYHVRFRAYAPRWGRWLQRDPAGYVDGGSLVEYVGGSPIPHIDSYGLYSDITWWENVPGYKDGMKGTHHHKYSQHWFWVMLYGKTGGEHVRSTFTRDGEDVDSEGRCEYQREAGCGVETVAKSVVNGLEAGQATVVILVCAVTPGPEDAAIVALPLLRNLASVSKTVDGWKGVTKCGDEVVLSAEEATKLDKLVAEGKMPGKAVDLASQEGKAAGKSKGHTIEKHVGKDDKYLKDRIKNEQIQEASTYADKAQAEAAVNKIMSDPKKLKEFEDWVKGGMKGTLPLHLDDLGMGPIGTVCSASGMSAGKGARVVWKRGDDGNPMILTSHPIP
jgi:RHS repeat-associated protein